jgi:hypothetical protein
VYNQGFSGTAAEVCTIPFAVRRDHNTGVVQVTITNEGNIGYTHWKEPNDSLGIDSIGLGFVYYGNNFLFEAGLMIGTSQDQISDCVRNDSGWNQDEDFVEVEETYLHIHTPGSITSEEGTAILNDSGADNPLGIRIKQKSYADAGFEIRNGMVFHYTLVNESGSDLSGLYAGLFFDWDLMDHLVNSAHYNADYQMVYAQNQTEGPTHFAGTMLLNLGLGANIDVMHDWGDDIYSYSDETKWSNMTGGVNAESVFNANVSTYTGIGPVDIAAGDSVSFGIAALAANSVYELEYVAGEIRNFWDTHFPEELGNAGEAALPQAYALHQNYPNPFNPVTTIRFDVPEESHIRLDVYNVLGQRVQTLVNGNMQPGFHVIRWNGTNDTGTPLASGMYFYIIHSSKFTAVKKLVLMK